MRLKKGKFIKEVSDEWNPTEASSHYDELLKHPAPFAERAGIYIFLGFFVVFSIYLFLGEIDEIVPADGGLRPKGNYYTVEAQETGSVTNIYVKPGDYRKKGDPILELEFSEQAMELTKDTNNLAYEERKLQRLIRTKSMADKILRNLESNLENNSGSELSGPILSKFVSLKKSFTDYKNGVGAKFLYDQSLLEFNEEYVNLRDEIQLEQNLVSSLKGDTQLKKERVENAFIKMPFDGYIGLLMVNNVGQNINRGSAIAELIEEGRPLEALVEIPNRDIGVISIGMDAIIKVKAFHQNDFGIVVGKVDQIIPNVKEKDTFSLVLSLNEQILKKDGKDFKLFPGLKVEADIITSRNQIFSILFRRFYAN